MMPRNLPEAAKTSSSTLVSPARVETIEHVETEDFSTWSLEALALEAKEEHAAFIDSALKSLGHAIRAGEALLAAKSRIEAGLWDSWRGTHIDMSKGTTNEYMRIATYRHRLPNGVGIEAARMLLRGLPTLPRGRQYSDEIRNEARQLFASGTDRAEIAKRLHITPETVRRWVDSNYKARRLGDARRSGARLRAARRALAEKERQQARIDAAKKAGGALAESNSRVRLLLESLDQAVGEAKDRELQATLREARGHADKAEYAILKALGVS